MTGIATRVDMPEPGVGPSPSPEPAPWREANRTAVPVPGPACIHAWFEDQAAAAPDQAAMVSGERLFTYRDVNTQANRLARRLIGLGVGPGVPVALYLGRGPEAVVAILAVLKAGGAYVPLDGSYPLARVAAIVADARAPVLVTQAAVLGEAAAAPRDAGEARIGGARVLQLDREQALIDGQPADNPPCATTGDDPAFILFTSGSTGAPKGVRVLHRNLVNYRLLWERECALSSTVSAIGQTAFFSFAVFQGDWIRALCFGKTLVLCDTEALHAPARLVALLRRSGVDFMECVPALLRGVIAHLQASGERLDCLRVLVIGADRWYLREHLEARRHLGPETRFIHVYGLSETTLDSTRFEHSDLPLNPDQPTPIGRPFTNVQAHVLDEALQPVPVGEEGELCIGGAGVTGGYLNLPELTAQKFVPDPFSAVPGARLFRTGDIARWLPDGQLAFIGRRDQQVKLQGFRIELGEIEAVLEQHPGVATAVVQGVELRPGATLLVAWWVPKGEPPGEAALRAHAAARLPLFMVPARWVRLPALPLTPSGKIDRRALPPPDTRRPALATGYRAPADGLQTTIAEAWQRVLGLDEVGVDDNFFDLGGGSLLMLQLQAALHEALQRELPIVQLYQQPTVRALARALAAAGADGDHAKPANSGDSGDAADTTDGLATAPAQALARAGLRRELLGRRTAAAGRRAPQLPPGEP